MILVQFIDGRLQRQLPACDLQSLNEIGGAGEQHAQAVFDERQSNGGGEMALAGTRWTDKDEIGTFIQPAVGGGKRVDLGFGDHGDDVEVEVIEGLAGWQTGFGQVSLDAPLRPLSDLVFGQGG